MASRKEANCGTGFHVRTWVNKDPCGIICALLSWFFILYAESVVVGIIIYPWFGLSFYGLIHITLFSCICFLALISHGKAVFTDPGAVPNNILPLSIKNDMTRLEDQKYRTCRRCRQYKPARAHHCSICQRCVIKMDHHCPWVNNCVGIGNHKFFLLFIFYVFLLSAYALTLVIFRYAKCANYDCPSFGAMRVAALLVEAVLFGLFTLCMMCDQYSVIMTGTTQIDRLKGDYVESLGIREVFGGSSNSFSYTWLLPIDIWFPSSLKDQLLGFQVDDHMEKAEDYDDYLSETDTFLSSDSPSIQSSQGQASAMSTNEWDSDWKEDDHDANETSVVV